MAAKLKKGDKIIVLAGKDKGKEGEIAKINPSTGKAIVEGVNIAIRHIKQSQNTQGGKVPQAMPIQISNLSLVDTNGKATRVGFKISDGKKARFAKTTGDLI
jgi:large subunit ribosomal protein L24